MTQLGDTCESHVGWLAIRVEDRDLLAPARRQTELRVGLVEVITDLRVLMYVGWRADRRTVPFDDAGE
jgi:hypothetical protein